MLDKGDLQGALEELKKLVGGGEKGAGLPEAPAKPKAPDLGPKPPMADKPMGGDKLPMPAPKQASCSNCGIILELPEDFFAQ